MLTLCVWHQAIYHFRHSGWSIQPKQVLFFHQEKILLPQFWEIIDEKHFYVSPKHSMCKGLISCWWNRGHDMQRQYKFWGINVTDLQRLSVVKFGQYTGTDSISVSRLNVHVWSHKTSKLRDWRISIQSSAVITRSDIVRLYIDSYRDWGRISIKCWMHKRHPWPRSNGWAMGYLLWIFVRKLSALKRHRTVLCLSHRYEIQQEAR